MEADWHLPSLFLCLPQDVSAGRREDKQGVSFPQAAHVNFGVLANSCVAFFLRFEETSASEEESATRLPSRSQSRKEVQGSIFSVVYIFPGYLLVTILR